MRKGRGVISTEWVKGSIEGGGNWIDGMGRVFAWFSCVGHVWSTFGNKNTIKPKGKGGILGIRVKAKKKGISRNCPKKGWNFGETWRILDVLLLWSFLELNRAEQSRTEKRRKEQSKLYVYRDYSFIHWMQMTHLTHGFMKVDTTNRILFFCLCFSKRNTIKYHVMKKLK